MKTLIFFVALIIIAIVAFLTWFLSSAADGKCPLCALKALGRSKLTMDISDEEDYANQAPATPIMGWSSWNALRNHIDEDTVFDVARAMKDSGLADAGYQYINIDDCWQSSLRDSDGKLQGDLEAFPSGMEALCQRINALGLKMGIYSSNGTLTCEDMPASLGNEVLDAKTFASWGVEFVKYDFCHHERISGSTPLIEYVDISRRGSSREIRLLPEDAAFTGKARVVKCTDLPSQQGIGYLNHNAGTAVFETEIPVSGEYVFTVHYHKNIWHKKQYLQIVINGKVHEVHFPAGFSMSHDAKAQIEVKLLAGATVIELRNPIVTRADSSYMQYRRMGKALQEAAQAWAMFTNQPLKPMVYSICEWGFSKPWHWGAKAGNMWRTTMDITPHWKRIVMIYKKNLKLYQSASPSHINDPDMLEVGNGKLTPEENKAHFTLWCMMAAPLVLGNDLRTLLDGSQKSNILLNILTNNSLIVVDQDPLVKPAKKIKSIGSIDVLARPLYNGDIAICFFNKGGSKKPAELDIATLKDEGYLGFTPSPNGYEIHDLWSDDRTLGDKITTNVPKHGVKAFRISIA